MWMIQVDFFEDLVILLLHLLQDTLSHAESVCRCLLKSSCHRCTVTDCAQTGDACLEVLIYDNFVGVEFYLNTVEQSLITCDTRRYLVECDQHLADIFHDTVRQNERQIARNSIL